MGVSISAVKHYAARARYKLETQSTITACMRAAQLELIVVSIKET